MVLIRLLLLTLILSGCSELNRSPFLSYDADITISQVDELERIIIEFGRENVFEVYEKDKHDAILATNGSNAFFIEYRYHNKTILVATNISIGERFRLYFFDNSKLSRYKVREISTKLITKLNNKGYYLKKEINRVRHD